MPRTCLTPAYNPIHDPPHLTGPGRCQLCLLDTPTMPDGTPNPVFSPAHHAMWSGQTPPTSTLPCVHRSAESTGSEQCQTCQGTVRIKLYGCDIHKSCTIATVLPGYATCQTCKDRCETK
jgi:hypothetical protein